MSIDSWCSKSDFFSVQLKCFYRRLFLLLFVIVISCCCILEVKSGGETYLRTKWLKIPVGFKGKLVAINPLGLGRKKGNASVKSTVAQLWLDAGVPWTERWRDKLSHQTQTRLVSPLTPDRCWCLRINTYNSNWILSSATHTHHDRTRESRGKAAREAFNDSDLLRSRQVARQRRRISVQRLRHHRPAGSRAGLPGASARYWNQRTAWGRWCGSRHQGRRLLIARGVSAARFRFPLQSGGAAAPRCSMFPPGKYPTPAVPDRQAFQP